MLNKLKQKILSNSDTYNYFKNEHAELSRIVTQQQTLIADLTKDLKKHQKELDHVKRYNNRFLKSNHNLLKTLYLHYDLQSKGVLKQSFDFGMELLTFFENICKKHDLEFWLDYGTALGAIRHGKHIPWDDDIDIAMMRKDFDAFYSIAQEEIEANNLNDVLSANLNTQNEENNILTFLQFSYRLKDISPRVTLGYIDIFPYDYIDYSNLTEEKYTEVRTKYYYEVFENGAKKALNDYLNTMNIKYDGDKFIIPGPENPRGLNEIYPFKISKNNTIFPLKKAKFWNKLLPIPNNIDRYLKDIYGNYTDIPEFVRHHSIVHKAQKNPNIKNLYDDAIKRIKQVNTAYCDSLKT